MYTHIDVHQSRQHIRSCKVQLTVYKAMLWSCGWGGYGGQCQTYPQFTQAMVPCPFTTWATVDSSFRWLSPDVAVTQEGQKKRQFKHLCSE